MTLVACVSAGMAVCKPVFVTFGAALGLMMRCITVGGGIILTSGSMAYVTDAVIGKFIL